MSRWGKMRSLFMSDEELGKKDDDHKAVRSPGKRHVSWQPARVAPRRMLRRIVLIAAAAVVVFLFIRNIPILGPNDRMRRPTYPPSGVLRRPPYSPSSPPPGYDMHPPDPAVQPQPKDEAQILPAKPVERNFNGPLKYHNLAASLQAIANTRSSLQNNKNILFVAASLRSATALLPMACQMGSNLQNHVHFALLGRADMDMEQLRQINGVDKTCPVSFHDGRPDYAAISTEGRLENSVYRAFHHINKYMHPQAIFVDGSNDEEAFLTRGVARHVKLSKTTLIKLPGRAGKTLDWIAMVDSAGLWIWDKVQIDISIQAQPGSSGGLIRLLRSLAAADYTSSIVPHITLELPHQIDKSVKTFLDSFEWPPVHIDDRSISPSLSIRRRISDQRLTEDESLARFFESFWPAQPQISHVLMLSPDVEVAPQFFNYLKYLLLEYRYSTAAGSHNWDRRLFGISLEQPSLTLEGKPFSPPLFQHPDDVNGESGGTPNPFLWQAPASNAVLILGDKWVELHDFVSRTKQALKKLDATPSIISKKSVSRQHPSWLEHALRLARIRGYWFVYPGEEVAGNLATVHGELYTIPEEYAGERTRTQEKGSVSDNDAGDDDDVAAAGDQQIKDRVRSTAEQLQISSPSSRLLLEHSLPNNGKLWPLTALPIAAWDGAEVRFQDLRTSAGDFEIAFKKAVGGCDAESGKRQKPVEPMVAQDLFCNVP